MTFYNSTKRCTKFKLGGFLTKLIHDKWQRIVTCIMMNCNSESNISNIDHFDIVFKERFSASSKKFPKTFLLRFCSKRVIKKSLKNTFFNKLNRFQSLTEVMYNNWYFSKLSRKNIKINSLNKFYSLFFRVVNQCTSLKIKAKKQDMNIWSYE